MKLFSLRSPWDIIKFAIILSGAIVVIWMVMVSPNDYEWTPSGETEAVIETILPSKTVIGQTTIKALVKTADGATTIVSLPMKTEFTEGADITLTIMEDQKGSGRFKYVYDIPSLP